MDAPNFISNRPNIRSSILYFRVLTLQQRFLHLQHRLLHRRRFPRGNAGTMDIIGEEDAVGAFPHIHKILAG